jgi:YidC/Oxa1 family membrane protein insertase
VPPTVRTVVVPAETLVVRAGTSTYSLSTAGGAPTAVALADHRAFTGARGNVNIHNPGGSLLGFRVVTGADTIALDRLTFAATQGGPSDTPIMTFTSRDPAVPATIEYRVTATPYLSDVRIQVPQARERAYLLVSLPGGFASQEADTLDDIRHLSYAAKPVAKGASGVTFSSVDPAEREIVPGPLSWAVAKSKYFVVGLLSPSDSAPFAEMQVTGGPRVSKLATQASGVVVIPLTNGEARFQLFAGPQSWEQMRALGREFETANPYGGFMQPVVQPFATIVMRMMLWLKRFLQLDYGWILVIFGLAIRIVLWPLNQSAMRSSIRLQRIQPELMAVQEKYKTDRQKQQQEILRVYQEHGMSPFSALSGCLPALIPMPVFFALFFVFQNTIEFRGVPFLWLADISLKDPLYILPVVTGASMFVLSWIGMRNMPKNPQATMMLYLMPGMFTIFLLSTASGLSIYYLVQQIAAIPQQWMIANERKKAVVAK